MATFDVVDLNNSKTGSVELNDAIWAAQPRKYLLTEVVHWHRAKRRAGTHDTQQRADVNSTTKKPYKQKGTGNARVGTRRTPTRKGGGVAFAKTKTREAYRLDMPRKQRQLANRNALLAKLVDSEVKVVDRMDFAEPKTSVMRNLLAALGVDRTCLVALDRTNRNAALAARNLADADTIRAEQLNAFELLNHRYLVIEKAQLEAFVDGSLWRQTEEVA